MHGRYTDPLLTGFNLNGLTRQVVTPRFIPTCSDALLEGLGRLAAKHRARGCWVQSHLAEVSRSKQS